MRTCERSSPLTETKIERSKPMWMTGTVEHDTVQGYALSHLANQVKDPVIRRKLTPTSQIGCKRMLFLDDWYPIFNKSNTELITDKPVEITSSGIISKPPNQLSRNDLDGEPVGSYTEANQDPDSAPKEREIDVLIWGTGSSSPSRKSSNAVLMEVRF